MTNLMINNKLTDERIAALANGKGPVSELWEEKAMAAELQEYRNAKPVMYCMSVGGLLDPELASACKSVVDSWVDEWSEGEGGPRYKTVPLYTTPQPLSDAELQECRKALEDKDLQGVINALEYPVGINAAGKQVVRRALFELQECRKAAESPIAWTDAEELRAVGQYGCGYMFEANPVSPHADPRRVIKLYTAPQPLSEAERAELQGYRKANAGVCRGDKI